MARVFVYTFILIAGWFPAIAAAADFDTWRDEFRTTALAAGISASTFDTAFRTVEFDPHSAKTDANQAEFVRPIWGYLDNAVTASRISTGKAKARIMKGLLDQLEQKYRVDSEVLLAIWGMETNFGAFRGKTYTVNALANAAYNGRRRAFAESELIAALKILARGDITPARMLGSSGGAMGHTQFMPSTYLRFGVDQDRDGKADIWSDSPTDALASAANYLRTLGWEKDQPWGMEVTVPREFNYALIGEYETRNARFWNARGVRTAHGDKIPNYRETSLIAPAGANGPIFAIFPNFQVIRQYNMSVSYSLAVGHLSDRLNGGSAFKADWPRSDPPMTRANQREIQSLLQKHGFDVGPIDGMIGPKTVEAIQAFQISEGLLADGYATRGLLNRLRP